MEARVALVAGVAKVHVGLQHDLVLGRADALVVRDHLAREALGVLFAQDLLGVRRHAARRRRVLHDRDADRADVGLLARRRVLLLV